MECDRNSAEYKKMVDLKERTERAVKEVVEQMNKLEPDEMFDEIERLRKEKEYNAEVEGTLRPADKFNAEEYARILKNDMIFVSFTYQTAIDRLACVTNSQRQDIVKSFQQVYRKDLIIELKSLLLRQYEDLIDGLMMLPEEFDAYELNRAIHTRKDRDTMIEILCSRSNAQIQKINEAYRRMYRQELENDITGRMKGNLDQLLVSLAKGGRMEKQAVDMDEAYSDAQFLYKAREKGWRSDESQLNMIMASRSYEQLKAVFDVYCKTYGRNIETDIKSGMLPIIKCVRNRPGYFAEKIYKSIMNIDYFCLLQSGTVDDGTLIRVMVTRAEVDMVQIKQEFQKMYGQSFEQFVMKHREKTDTERKESKAHLVNSTMHFENKLEKQVAILDLTISLAEHRYV